MTGLDTARLLLRPVPLSDTEAFFAFGGDPVAMRYTHCHTSVRECRRRLAAFEWQRRKLGYAPWAAIAKADGRLIGWGGLYLDPFDFRWGPELGYSFHPTAWEQGFATELARTCLYWADSVLGLPEVSAFASGQRRLAPYAGQSGLRDDPRRPGDGPHPLLAPPEASGMTVARRCRFALTSVSDAA